MRKNYKFMTCHWENLIYINFQIQPELLSGMLPEDIEPDTLDGKAILSIVCFEFSNARLFGCKIPFHQYFPEVNIRTYVKRKDNGNVKGIYFLSEMVPKLMTFFTGKFIYGEPFSLRDLTISKKENQLKYTIKDAVCEMSIEAEKTAGPKAQRWTEEQKFVINRSLAFCGKAGKNSKMYEVLHQPWNLIPIKNPDFVIKRIKHINSTVQNILLQRTPESIFMTDGSKVEVFKNSFI
ncbi:DUF2071 domain-containing protein [Chryseobacterium daecheongense]|uniref:DUF2071 domain-containing protein n=1 Tax=Chryseobacterium daecheongense TaxID=192389 RepID=A0A3N0W539_9FLAO|nr:DUF2071 domain-containing protein [Chryseobacterium daecheongense]ROI00187.1 DUF2071 domain-containing protein [Chryseobacterium daecheongense]TDX94858.1 hypothetical protein BCF50_0629 [Chryseobacterium daecheongense]